MTEPPRPNPSRDAKDVLYGSPAANHSRYAPALADSMGRLADTAGLTAEQRESAMTTAVEFFTDAGIAPPHAARLHSLMAAYTAEPVDDATEEEWMRSTRERLRTKYGDPAEGERRLATAQQFIAARPKLQQMLNATGLGSHPDVVMALVENARDLRVVPATAEPKPGQPGWKPLLAR